MVCKHYGENCNNALIIITMNATSTNIGGGPLQSLPAGTVALVRTIASN